jgi:hypothetical protein
MNRWAAEGGNPFANAKWDEAWKTTRADASQWEEIRTGLRAETERWLKVLKTPREVAGIEFTGPCRASRTCLPPGAIRQIDRTARGPKEERSSGAGGVSTRRAPGNEI